MLFFKRKAKPRLKVNAEFTKTGRCWRIPCSDMSRGMVKRSLSTYGDDFAQRGIRELLAENPTQEFKGCAVFVEEGKIMTTMPPTLVLNFSINGRRIGSKFQNEGETQSDWKSLSELVTQNKISGMHVKITKDGETYRTTTFCALKEE